MTDNVLISVIIPVYNGEKYISTAVQSVLAQTQENYEIILINDGSTDNSGQICDIFAQNSDKIRVVHKPNGGISSARNAGMAAALGEYFAFLDADDFLDPDTCEEIGKVIRQYHPDCIDFGWKYVRNSEEITENHHKIEKKVLLGENTIRNVILPPLLNLRNDPERFVYDFACTKVFRRDIIEQNKIVFDETRRIWEDRPFVVHYLKFCRNYYCMDRCFYNYVDVPGSLSRKYSLDFFRIIVENFQLYKSLYGEAYDFDAPYVNNYWSGAIESMVYRSLEQKENRDQIRKNICDALQNDQVVHWFSRRGFDGVFEEKLSSLVISGAYEDALMEYEKQARIRQKKQAAERYKLRAKRMVLRLLGRLWKK